MEPQQAIRSGATPETASRLPTQAAPLPNVTAATAFAYFAICHNGGWSLGGYRVGNKVLPGQIHDFSKVQQDIQSDLASGGCKNASLLILNTFSTYVSK